MATDDIYHVRFELTTWDVNHSFSFHAKDIAGEPEGTGGQHCALVMESELGLPIRNLLSLDTVLEAVYCRRVVGGNENPGLHQFPDQAGTIESSAYPPNSPLVISLIGEDAQLKRAGRMYIGGLPKDKINAGRLDAAYLAGPVKVLTDLLEADLLTLDGQFRAGVLRTVDNGVPLVTPIFIVPDEFVAKPIIYSQRRRNSKSRGTSTAEV